MDGMDAGSWTDDGMDVGAGAGVGQAAGAGGNGSGSTSATSTSTMTRSADDRGPVVFVVTTATLTLATVFVLARIICRVGLVRKFGWDDGVMVLAWLLAMSLSLSIMVGTRKGLGRHDVDIDDGDRAALRLCEYVVSVLYNPALMATKSSALIFYLYLSHNTRKMLRRASWTVLGVVNAAGVTLTLMNVFRCQPVRATWDFYTHVDTCIPLLTEFICSAPVNVITDLAILALPIPVLTGMRLPPRQKTILVVTFAVGIFVAAVDVVRIKYLQQALATHSSTAVATAADAFGHTPEFAWKSSLSLMWSAVEVNVAMTCACVPTLKPLVVRILPAMLGVGGPEASRRPSVDACRQSSADEASGRPSTDASSKTDRNMPVPVPILSRTPWRKLMPPRTAASRSVYFGFVNIKQPKSMLQTEGREALGYCAVVTILFLLWGFSYGLLNTLNAVVAEVAQMTTAETLGLTSAYFGGGYFFGPLLVGEWILRHDEHQRSRRGQPDAGVTDVTEVTNSIGGFKTTFIAGLLIYGVGTVMFWPSAVLTAFPGFLASSFVVGFGLAVLETAANPFLALCGPPSYAEARLCTAQGVQAVGSVLSGLLADRVFFGSITRRNGSPAPLLDVQWTYLAVTLLCVLLALFFYYMPLPEVSDRDLARAARRLPIDPKKRSLATRCLVLAVAAQWTYVAAQECTSVYFEKLVTAFAAPGTDQPPPLLSASSYLAVARSAFALSRFLAGLLAYLHVRHPSRNYLFPGPRLVLLASALLSLLFMLVVVTLQNSNNRPDALALPLILFYFAEGPLWPLIFAAGLRGQARRTKRAAAWLTMGASGPAFWPFVQNAVLQAGGSVQTAFVLALALLVVTTAYPLFLTLETDASIMVDPLAVVAGPVDGFGECDADGHVVDADVDVDMDMDMDMDDRILVAGKRLRRPSPGSHVMCAKDSYDVHRTRGPWRSTLPTSTPVAEHAENRHGDGEVDAVEPEGDDDHDRDGDGDATKRDTRRNTWAGPS